MSVDIRPRATDIHSASGSPDALATPFVRNMCGVLLSLFLASSAIAQQEPDDTISTTAKFSALNAFFHEPFKQPLGYSFFSWDAKERILDRFGEPNSESSSRNPARTSDEILWNTTLTYSGITFVVGESVDRTRTWLVSIEVRDSEHILANGLRVGSSRMDVVETFRNSPYMEYDGGIRFATEIWEARGEITLATAMELRVDIGDEGLVTRILIESIDL